MMKRRSGLLLALAMCLSGHAAGETVREQFAFAAQIEVWPGTSLQWFEIPLAVYRDAVDPDLSDLRVLNGRGEVVPFALNRPASVVVQPVSELRLPLFPLRGDPTDALSALSLTIREDSTSLEVQRGALASAAPVAAYLIDAQSVDAVIESLVFEIPESASDFSVTATLEVSDDLTNWRNLAGHVPLTRLRHGGAIFDNRSVSFQPTRARFWRLRAPSGGTLPEFSGALAVPVAGNVAVVRKELSVPGQHSDKAGEYLFDLGAHVPVDRVELELPDVNTVVQTEYFVRRAQGEPWRRVTRAGVYRLQTPNDELRSPPLVISAEASRYWRVVVDPRGGGIGAGNPNLRVGWLAHRVLFVARGAAPFELVYGNFAAENAETALGELLPGGALPPDATLPQPLAQVATPRLAGGLERLTAPPPPGNWRLAILWSALGIGVLSLAAVAWRLVRQMRASS